MDSSRNSIVLLIAVIILAGAIFLSAQTLSKKSSVSGSANVTVASQEPGIHVTGDGKIDARPDMAILNITASTLANTSKEALKQANEKIDQVTKIAKDNGVKAEDITTTSFNVYPEYDYTSIGGQKIKGQRASIGLTIKVKQLDEQATKASTIIDASTAITDIQVGQISFDIDDKTKFFSQARELAYKKSVQKAEELAKLSGAKVGTAISITDTVTDYSYNPQPVANFAMAEGKMMAPQAAMDSRSSGISTGQIQIQVNLSVTFGIE